MLLHIAWLGMAVSLVVEEVHRDSMLQDDEDQLWPGLPRGLSQENWAVTLGGHFWWVSLLPF